MQLQRKNSKTNTPLPSPTGSIAQADNVIPPLDKKARRGDVMYFRIRCKVNLFRICLYTQTNLFVCFVLYNQCYCDNYIGFKG